jgi:hypothetical protein
MQQSNNWFHYGEHGLFAAIIPVCDGHDLNCFQSADLFIERGKLLLGDTVASRFGKCGKLAPFRVKRHRDNIKVGRIGYIDYFILPLQHELDEAAPTARLFFASIYPPRKNASSEAATKDCASQGQVRDGYEWWVYVVAFVGAFLVTALPGIIALVKDKLERVRGIWR